jgi:hypothetical protein
MLFDSYGLNDGFVVFRAVGKVYSKFAFSRSQFAYQESAFLFIGIVYDRKISRLVRVEKRI